MAEILGALEGSDLAVALRGSTWAYPLVNAAHILGIALLVGAISPLDLRIMGFWRRTPLEELSRVLIPVAAAGLALAIGAGALLFVTRAGEYAASSLFLAKMGLIALALVNIAGYYTWGRRNPETIRRLFGTTSLAIWIAVLILGRLVGYF